MVFSLAPASFAIAFTDQGPKFENDTGYSLMSIPFDVGYPSAVRERGGQEKVDIHQTPILHMHI